MTVKVDRRWAVNDLAAIILESDVLPVTVLPDLGGKVLQVTSLRSGGDLPGENPRSTTLAVTHQVRTAVIHPTCSSTRSGASRNLQALAEAISDEVRSHAD